MKQTTFFQKTLKAFFCTLFVWISLNYLFLPSQTISPQSKYQLILSLLGWGILFGAILFLTRKIPIFFVNWLRSHQVLILTFIFCVLFFLQSFLSFFSFQLTGWDAGFIYETAYNSVATSNGPTPTHYYYYMYPNNLTLLSLEVNLLKFFIEVLNFSDFSLCYYLLILFNILLVDISIFFCFCLSRKFLSESHSYLVLLSCIFLYGFSPWITIVYSDTITQLFVPLILLTFIHGVSAHSIFHKCICFFLSGIYLLLGASIKPTVAIAGIAFFAWYVIKIKLCKIRSLLSIKKISIGVCVLFSLLTGMFAGYCANQSFTHTTIQPYGYDFSDSSQEMPWSHFLMMGLTVKTNPQGQIISYGAWNSDSIAYIASFPSKEEKVAGNIKAVEDTLHSMGAARYFRFLNEKLLWITNDGTFFWGGEGGFFQGVSPSVEAMQGNWGKTLKSWIVIDSPNYSFLQTLQQGLWLLFLVLIAVPLFIKDEFDLTCDLIGCLRFSAVGILSFILLFEGRSRYLISFLPVFAMLATYGLICIDKKIHRRE